MIHVSAEPLDSPDARRLIAELDDHLSVLYPPEDNFLELPVADVFLVARDGDDPVACGAVRFLDPQTAEVKRMYAAPRVRGQGIAWRILQELEAFARARGARRLVLETGPRQPEAIALYERAGFTVVPCWGEYASGNNSVCYEKRLP